MAKFVVPSKMIQLSFQSNDWHFISDFGDMQIFTYCGKVAFRSQSNEIVIMDTKEILAKEICKKCLGGIKAYDD